MQPRKTRDGPGQAPNSGPARGALRPGSGHGQAHVLAGSGALARVEPDLDALPENERAKIRTVNDRNAEFLQMTIQDLER